MIGKFLKRSRTRILENRNYTDAIVGRILAQAGQAAADAGQTSGLEIAAGLIARGFAAAEIEGPSSFNPPGPAMLSAIGRDLIAKGECVVTRIGGAWIRASSFDVSGLGDELGWKYRITFGGPSSTLTRDLAGSMVVHVRYSTDPDSPHTGIGPMERASLAADMHSNLELRLGEQSSAYAGSLIPIPSDGGEEELTMMKQDLAKLKGKQAFVETTSGGWQQGKASAPSGDWSVKHLGPAVNAGIPDLFKASQLSVLAACGCPIELVRTADGTGQREAYRRFFHSTLSPLGKILAEQLTKVAKGPVKITWGNYMADIQGLARAYSALIKSGMTPEQADEATGLTGESK